MIGHEQLDSLSVHAVHVIPHCIAFAWESCEQAKLPPASVKMPSQLKLCLFVLRPFMNAFPHGCLLALPRPSEKLIFV